MNENKKHMLDGLNLLLDAKAYATKDSGIYEGKFYEFIKDSGIPFYGNLGICSFLDGYCLHFDCGYCAYEIISEYAEDWEYFSGDVDFPIPDGGVDPNSAYGNTDDRLKWFVGRYATLRWLFVDYLIERLSNDLG